MLNSRGDWVGGIGSGHNSLWLSGDALPRLIRPGLDGGAWLDDNTILTRDGTALKVCRRETDWEPELFAPTVSEWFAGGGNWAGTVLAGDYPTSGRFNNAAIPTRFAKNHSIKAASRAGDLLFRDTPGNHFVLWKDERVTDLGPQLEARVMDGGAIMWDGRVLLLLDRDGSIRTCQTVSKNNISKPIRLGDWIGYITDDGVHQRWLHQWNDPSVGYVLQEDYGFDLIEYAGRCTYAGTLGTAEIPSQIYRGTLQLGVGTQELRVPQPSLPLVSIGKFSHPMYIAPFKAWEDVPTNAVVWDAKVPQTVLAGKYILGGPDGTPSQYDIGLFASLEGGGGNSVVLENFWEEVKIKSLSAKTRQRPLFVHLDGDWTIAQWFVTKLLEKCSVAPEIIPMVRCYPFGGNTPSIEALVTRWDAQFIYLKQTFRRVGAATVLYTQWQTGPETENFKLPLVMALQNQIADLLRKHKPILSGPFCISRDSGVTSYPEVLWPVLFQWADSVSDEKPAWLAVTQPTTLVPPIEEPSVPNTRPPQTFTREDLILFAFGNAYLQLIDFTKTHPDWKSITDDATRVKAAAKWVMDTWDQMVAKPNAEGYGTALRQWPTGESFDALIDRMGLERRGL